MRSFAKRALQKILASTLVEDRLSGLAGTQEVQALLKTQYRAMRGLPPHELPAFSDVGFRKFSQFEEDGILLFLF